MASGSGAFGAKCGFNQSGGANYIVVSGATLVGQVFDIEPTTGSGGAVVQAAPVTSAVWQVPTTGGLSSCLITGSLMKDMGKTVVSSARTFRKFQVLRPTLPLTNGVTGPAATAKNPGYYTFYIETNREGTDPDQAAAPAIARYF